MLSTLKTSGALALLHLLQSLLLHLLVTLLLLYSGAWANLLVGAFNLLPSLPLDGGMILEAVVWWVTGRRHAGTRVAAFLGRALAIGVVLQLVVRPLLSGRVRTDLRSTISSSNCRYSRKLIIGPKSRTPMRSTSPRRCNFTRTVALGSL